MAVALARQLFTVDDYYKMAETGILDSDDRVELLDGEILKMSPAGSYHSGCINTLAQHFFLNLQNLATVSIQNPVRLDAYSAPEPDVALLHYRDDHYKASLPIPEEIHLLVEVADSSLDKDLYVKIPLYAKALVPEAWIIDLSSRTVHVFRDPSDGEYQSRAIYSENDRLAPVSFPDIHLPVNTLF